jgi:hypothetical protein
VSDFFQDVPKCSLILYPVTNRSHISRPTVLWLCRRASSRAPMSLVRLKTVRAYHSEIRHTHSTSCRVVPRHATPRSTMPRHDTTRHSIKTKTRYKARVLQSTGFCAVRAPRRRPPGDETRRDEAIRVQGPGPCPFRLSPPDSRRFYVFCVHGAGCVLPAHCARGSRHAKLDRWTDR